jgi:hypothetical protein
MGLLMEKKDGDERERERFEEDTKALLKREILYLMWLCFNFWIVYLPHVVHPNGRTMSWLGYVFFLIIKKEFN